MTSPEKRSETRSVRGIVVPIAWSPSGAVTRVAILGPEEVQYDVLPRGQGRALVDCLQEEVMARLRVEGDARGAKIATVLSFQVLDESARPT